MKPHTTRKPGAWRLESLVWALRKARWGDLAGRAWHGVRAVLVALVEIARRDRATLTGRVETTEWQIAGHTGYTTRWVRKCLQLLEYAGIITWWRGGIAYGRPQPSIILISRRTLGALLASARQDATRAEADHRAETIDRLKKLRSGFVKSPQPRYRRSDHAELNANLHPHGEASTGRTPANTFHQPTLQQMIDTAAVAVAGKAPPAPSMDHNPWLDDIRATIAAARRR